MQPIHIFRAGKHEPSGGGGALNFSESDLQASAEAYDPAISEAPIVIGHPNTDSPAWGWVGALNYAEGDLRAEPRQVADEFAEMVKAGRFKNRSASFYRPDAPSNPVPGVYYLRHVGFLGATPPSVKGLDPVQFSEGSDEVVEFADPQFTASVLARVVRSLRDFLIDKHGRDEADKVIPEFTAEDLEAAAREPNDSSAEPAFSEPGSNNRSSQGADMKPEELQAKQNELTDRERKIQEREDAIKQQAADFAEKERERKQAEHVAFAENLVKENKLLPKHQAAVVGVLNSLDSDEAEASVQFAEGDETKITPADALRKILQDDERVDFREKSADRSGDLPPDAMKAQEIANRALKFQEDQEKEGRKVTIIQATKHVTEQLAAAS